MIYAITESYDLTDATWEIVIMLLIAFALGYLFRSMFADECPSCADAHRDDDLKIVEGIGRKIEVLLKDADICSFKKLSKTSTSMLKSILHEAGPRYRMHNPASWPEQARLAYQERWEELAEYKKFLISGRE